MADKGIIGALVLILTIAYTLFVVNLNFPASEKILLFIPSIIFVLVFLLLAMGKYEDRRGESTFPY